MNNLSINEILNSISKLNLLELSQLIIEIEKKFNLKTEFVKEEVVKNKFDIYLKEIGDKKINLIKVIKEVTNLSLKESKDLIENKNSLIKNNLNKKDCDEIAKKLIDAGAKIEIK